MPGQVSQAVKEERNQRLLEVVNEIGARQHQKFVGRQVQILVEGPSKKNPARMTGRTRCNKIVVFDGSAAAPRAAAGREDPARRHLHALRGSGRRLAVLQPKGCAPVRSGACRLDRNSIRHGATGPPWSVVGIPIHVRIPRSCPELFWATKVNSQANRLPTWASASWILSICGFRNVHPQKKSHKHHYDKWRVHRGYWWQNRARNSRRR